MPGRIKTAPSGAIFCCPDGRIFAGCDPCGACPFHILQTGALSERLNIIKYVTGMPQVDSFGIAERYAFEPYDYILDAFYLLYLGRERSADEFDTIPELCELEVPANPRTGIPLPDVQVVSDAAVAQVVRVSPASAPVPWTSGTYPNGPVSVAVDPLTYPLTEMPSSLWGTPFIRLNDNMEAMYNVLTEGVYPATFTYSSDVPDSSPDCDSEAAVSVGITKLDIGEAYPMSISVVGNFLIGAEEAFQTDHVLHDYYAMTKFGYSSTEAYDTYTRVLFTDDPAITGFDSYAFRQVSGFSEGSGDMTMEFIFDHVPGGRELTSVRHSVLGGGWSSNYVTVDADIHYDPVSGVVSGAATAYQFSGAYFFVAAFGTCPTMPEPRIREGKFFGQTYRTTGSKFWLIDECEYTINTWLHWALPAVPVWEPPKTQQIPPMLGGGLCQAYAFPNSLTSYLISSLDPVPRATLTLGEAQPGLTWVYQENLLGDFTGPEMPRTLDPSVVVHLPLGPFTYTSGAVGEAGDDFSFTTVNGIIAPVEPLPYVVGGP